MDKGKTPVDVKVSNMGSIYLVALRTDAARLWVDDYVEQAAQFWGDELVVEPRYVGALVEGMLDYGLIVE